MPHVSPTRRPIHHSLMAILFPPLAHWHHRRYEGKPHHLVIDSGLNVVMLGLALWVGIGIWFALQVNGIGIRVQPAAFRNNDATAIYITVQNQNKHPLLNTKAFLQLPRHWTLLRPDEDLQIGTLNSFAQKKFSVAIIPHGTVHQQGIIKIVIQGQRGSLAVTQSANLLVRLSSMPVTLTATNTTGSLGHPMTIHINITSDSDNTMDYIALQPQFSSSIHFVQAVPKLVDHRWVIIQLTPQTTQEFSVAVQPGKTGILQFPIRLAALDTGYILDHIQNIPLTISTATSAPDLLTTPSQTGANVAAEAVYYSNVGFQFGYGHFPPRVGEETGFRIFWYVQPSTTAATGVTMTAVLPAGVVWKGNSSVTAGSAMSYDAGQRRVRWAIGSWAANQGAMTGSFDVSITPTTSQIGLYPALTGPASLSYIDASGGLQTVRTGSVSTATADPKNRTSGRVQRALQ